MVVKKNYRGEGYGKAILQYVLSFAKEKGYSEIVLGVDCDNTVALNLYKKLGVSNRVQAIKIIRGEEL